MDLVRLARHRPVLDGRTREPADEVVRQMGGGLKGNERPGRGRRRDRPSAAGLPQLVIGAGEDEPIMVGKVGEGGVLADVAVRDQGAGLGVPVVQEDGRARTERLSAADAVDLDRPLARVTADRGVDEDATRDVALEILERRQAAPHPLAGVEVPTLRAHVPQLDTTPTLTSSPKFLPCAETMSHCAVATLGSPHRQGQREVRLVDTGEFRLRLHVALGVEQATVLPATR